MLKNCKLPSEIIYTAGTSDTKNHAWLWQTITRWEITEIIWKLQEAISKILFSIWAEKTWKIFTKSRVINKNAQALLLVSADGKSTQSLDIFIYNPRTRED